MNFPYNCKETIKGVKIARQGKSYWQEAPEKRIHPEGLPYYWLGGTWGAVGEDPLSDVAYLEQGYIAATPIHVGELTCNNSYEKFKNFSEKDLNIATEDLANN